MERACAFHTDHKFLLLAHGRTRYAELGALVAHSKELPLEELYGRYLKRQVFLDPHPVERMLRNHV